MQLELESTQQFSLTTQIGVSPAAQLIMVPEGQQPLVLEVEPLELDVEPPELEVVLPLELVVEPLEEEIHLGILGAWQLELESIQQL